MTQTDKKKRGVKRGFKHSDKTKKLMRQSNRRVWAGKKLPEEMKARISIAHIRRAKTHLPQAINKNIEILVSKRDLLTCQKCGKIGLLGQFLRIQVIDKNSPSDCLSNLITICKSCQKEK